ncbi:MAG TPA: hypothetical protein VKA48_05300 [Gammaproteobacteria bacterium]|nr:hypothetical protein [Gammaproteobacteria bacterium]
MSKRRITADMLAEAGAHCDQLDEFRGRFPDGLDPETVQPEEIADLDVGWAVHYMLPIPTRKAFWEAREAALESYMGTPFGALKARNSAWKAYREAKARAAIDLFRRYWSYDGEEAKDE